MKMKIFAREWAIIGLLVLTNARAEEYDFPTFSDTSAVLFAGDAQLDAGRVQLTSDARYQNGSVWLSEKVNLGISFDCEFSFMTGGGQGQGADGFALVIHNDPRGLSAIGETGGDLGFGDIHRALVIEFDTFHNPNGDPNANHVAVLSNGVRLVTSDHNQNVLSSEIWTPPFTLEDSVSHVARIVYRPGILDIYVGETELPEIPVLSVPVNLSNIDGSSILDDASKAFVGFTASTGFSSNFHFIESFTLSTGTSCPVSSEIAKAICVEWNSEEGARYQILRSNDLVTWVPINEVYEGDGKTMRHFQKVTEEETFFSVVKMGLE